MQCRQGPCSFGSWDPGGWAERRGGKGINHLVENAWEKGTSVTSPWWGLRGPRALMVTQTEETRWAEASLSATSGTGWHALSHGFSGYVRRLRPLSGSQLHIPGPRDIVTLMSHSAVWGQGFRGEHGTAAKH